MTTATCEHITREEIASEQEAVRHNIMRRINQLTNNGAALVDGYMAFINGEYPDAKPYLVQNAIRDLSLMGEKIPQNAPAPVVRQEDMPKPKKPKLTMKEINCKFVGDYIRRETDDCLNLIPEFDDFLNPPYVFKSANPEERKVQKALEFKPHHRFAAMNELGKRTVGGINPYPSYPLTSAWEDRILKSQFAQAGNRFLNDGIAYARHLLDVVKNDDYLNAKGEIIGIPYTQSQRFKALRILLYYGVDVPWEHITYDAIDAYLRDLYDSERANAERLIAQSKASAHAELAPDQKASVLEMFEQMQSATDAADAKAAKKAKKAAKKAHAAKSAAVDYNASNRNSAATGKSAANRNSAATGKNPAATADNTGKHNANSPDNAKSAVDAKDTGNANGNSPDNAKDAGPGNAKNAAATDNTSKRNGNGNSAATAANAKDAGPANGNSPGDTADATDKDTPVDRGATAVANALARHPEVDLDTALENFPETVGVPKNALTHDLIYRAIIAEANYQKRQVKFKNLPPTDGPAAPEDGYPPNNRSP